MTAIKKGDNMRQLAGRSGRTLVNGLSSQSRRSSTASPLLSHLEEKLLNQRLFLSYDYLSPQPSHLLRVSLSDPLNLPESKQFEKNANAFSLPSVLQPGHMPRGHHLVYFPPQLPSSQLVPDGCDMLHSPGAPFNRRMWAGGSVRFRDQNGGPLLNCQRAVCLEGVRDVRVIGREGEEKVFVGIERRIATVAETESEENITRKLWTAREEEWGDAVVIEKRNLVFMRDKTPDQVSMEKSRGNSQKRVLRGEKSEILLSTQPLTALLTAPSSPTLRHTFTPSRALLFRFSALTFNAHSIHLDRDYARNTEGYDDLLVHGPLTLTLMLMLVQDHLRTSNRVISSIEYRNLAPLLVEQPLTVCAKSKETAHGDLWDVWIERADGGMAVKGTIGTKSLERRDESTAATPKL
ncbi:conserved hypothetical protein [Uncinocarpus reesii 1704]|uniref:MaoC-like domain-containing protein n=1 Tax=Uncinocarpus reesii (strain UAMH 1704) TaxID=336963 RepID=C4JMG9_UNCRE|nr:uncharacterized protein UREG_04027 [Uncinocarpus reesii 1704]EEP79181.1 conserved hypothetical protein [Uncinocarpus reesii 1704]